MPCPFYGLGAHTDVLLLAATFGNQCALRVEGFAPCLMEVSGEEPAWGSCRHFNDPAHAGMVQAMRWCYHVWTPGRGGELPSFESRFRNFEVKCAQSGGGHAPAS